MLLGWQNRPVRLADWIARAGLPVKQVAELSGVSRASVTNARNGVPLETFELAKRLSDFTNGEVTIEDLSDPTGEVRRRIALDVVPWARVHAARAAAASSDEEASSRPTRTR